MPKYDVTITYSFTIDAKHEQEAEEMAYEHMEDCQPNVEVGEIESDEED